MSQLATVRDLIENGSQYNWDFNIIKNDIIVYLRYHNYPRYEIRETLSKADLLEYISKRVCFKKHTLKQNELSDFCIKINNTNVISVNNTDQILKYHICSTRIHPHKNHLKKDYIIYNKNKFCTFYFDSNFIVFYENAKLFNTLNQNSFTLKENISNEINKELLTMSDSIYTNKFRVLLNFCYQYVDTITMLQSYINILLNISLDRIVSNTDIKSLSQFLSANINPYTMHTKNEILGNVNTERYKEVTTLILKTKMMFPENGISISNYNLIMNIMPTISKKIPNKIKSKKISDFLDKEYFNEINDALKKHSALNFFIEPNDLEYYPYWRD